MSDLVGNPEDRFSQNEAHFVLLLLNVPVNRYGYVGTVTSVFAGKTLSTMYLMYVVPSVLDAA